jgi:DNA-binding GntR family transcriptional regulator
LTTRGRTSVDPTSATEELDRGTSTPRAEWVYELLRTRIAEGRIRPNTRLVETALADELQISRTPVREGIQRLAAAGYVVGGRGGWVVREHSALEIQEIYEARAALEGYASRLTAFRATEEELDVITRTHGAEGHRLMRLPREELVVVNDSFHNAIVEASGNKRLIELIASNRAFYFNYRIAEIYTSDEIERSIVQHEGIMGALWDRDGDRAEAVTRQHILTSVPIVISRLRPPSEGDLPELIIDQVSKSGIPGEDIT